MTYDDLKQMARNAETGEQWAEICRLEAEMEAEEVSCPRCGDMRPRETPIACEDFDCPTETDFR